jgi:hypothetical protein
MLAMVTLPHSAALAKDAPPIRLNVKHVDANSFFILVPSV